jgi:hypothetical protein
MFKPVAARSGALARAWFDNDKDSQQHCGQKKLNR